VAWGGGTITTINPTYTAPEVRHQLNDSGATLLVTIPAFLDTARAAVEGTGVREIAVIGDAPDATPLSALMGEPLHAQHPVDLDDHIVVLPYSSGTTGLSKGVMLSHRNLVVNIDQSAAAVDVRPGEWTVAFLPFFHIYGQTVLMNVYLARSANVSPCRGSTSRASCASARTTAPRASGPCRRWRLRLPSIRSSTSLTCRPCTRSTPPPHPPTPR
jgi:acyl-CoA synthetase (AMP-forming)/AMP-acid ligase II